MVELARVPVVRHRFRPHHWEQVDGLAGLYGVISQCSKCHLVRVYSPVINAEWRGSHEMLRDS